MAGNLLGTIRLPISLSRSKHRIAALRKFRWLQHSSPIPDHSLQRDLNEAALRQALRVAGQVPSTRQTEFEEIGSQGEFISALPPGLDLNSVADLQPRSVRAQTAESVPSRLFANCAEGMGALLECLEGRSVAQ
jgi:hypothetical protein